MADMIGGDPGKILQTLVVITLLELKSCALLVPTLERGLSIGGILVLPFVLYPLIGDS